MPFCFENSQKKTTFILQFLMVTVQILIITYFLGDSGDQISQYLSAQFDKYLQAFSSNSQIKEDQIFKLFDKAQQDLIKSNIDISLSGSTVILVILIKNKLICANCGDCRAVYGWQNEEGLWNSKNISKDHKPEVLEEKERIKNCGGTVMRINEVYSNQYLKQYGPFRVWLKNTKLPGISISRTLGDTIAKSIGVINQVYYEYFINKQPEIFEISELQDETIIILASDGLWEYVTNQEAIKLAGKYYQNRQAQKACQQLTRLAKQRWEQQQNRVDDISVVVIFRVEAT